MICKYFNTSLTLTGTCYSMFQTFSKIPLFQTGNYFPVDNIYSLPTNNKLFGWKKLSNAKSVQLFFRSELFRSQFFKTVITFI